MNIFKRLYNYLFVDEVDQELKHSKFIPYMTFGNFRRSIKDNKSIFYAIDYKDNTSIIIEEYVIDKYGDEHKDMVTIAKYYDHTQTLKYSDRFKEFIDIDSLRLK